MNRPRQAFPVLLLLAFAIAAPAQPLPDTKPLTAEGDLAAQMVAGIDTYLMRALAASRDQRKERWNPDYASVDAYRKSIQPQRQRLEHMLGLNGGPRVKFTDLEYISSTGTSHLVAEGEGYKVYAVRWPVLKGVDAEGLLVEPTAKPRAAVVALPDADWTPEMLVGLAPGVPRESQYARRLAENGCVVLVPTLIDRQDTWSGNPRLGRMTNQPHREFIYRMAFELGQHIIGYEIQKVLAAVDYFAQAKEPLPIGLIGHGEGGLLAFYAGALDDRIDTTLVSGYFGPREALWQEPIYRNVFGLLREFGDAEIAAYCYLPRLRAKDGSVVQRHLLIEDHARPEVTGPPAPRMGRTGAAPGRLAPADHDANLKEVERIREILGRRKQGVPIFSSERTSKLPSTPWMQEQFLKHLTRTVDDDSKLRPAGEPPTDRRKGFDPAGRQQRQFEQLVAFTQQLMHAAEGVRRQYFWSKLAKTPLDKWTETTQPFRRILSEEIIGSLGPPTEPANPRTRLLYDEPKWKGYEVTLDLYPDAFAYGILLVPKDMKEGEKRPVVVCQHGLEGRPQDVCNPKERTRAYNSYGAQLADRGYIVYAPQNPYIGKDNFRVLQRKANPLGFSLFSFIVRQHERTLDWLAGLPFVDKERIAFYGLSYGGKTAMRVPALLPRYCLSICSGDFNEWTWKNVSVEFPGSYMFTGEYEMPEFNMGSTIVYAEMAALIAPRPFMVERGHDDGVGIDEWVAYEFAKVRRLYTKLGIPDKTTIEFFDGGHVINGKGSFEFLDRHLNIKK